MRLEIPICLLGSGSILWKVGGVSKDKMEMKENADRTLVRGTLRMPSPAFTCNPSKTQQCINVRSASVSHLRDLARESKSVDAWVVGELGTGL